jgi:hypothetical protein
MNLLRKPAGESLALEDRIVSARSLPLDRETAERDFETATFGLG